MGKSTETEIGPVLVRAGAGGNRESLLNGHEISFFGDIKNSETREWC